MEGALAEKHQRMTDRGKECDENLRSPASRLMMLSGSPFENQQGPSSDTSVWSPPDIKMEGDSANEEDTLADMEDPLPLADQDEQFSFGQASSMCDEDMVTSDPPAKSKRQKKILKIGFNKSYRSIDPTTGKYKCLVCSKEFLAASGFYSHFNRVHLEIRFECGTCGKKFGRRTDYLRHNRSAHLSVRFKCIGCGKQFRRKSYLAYHLRRTGCLTKAGNMEMPTTSLNHGQILHNSNVEDQDLSSTLGECPTEIKMEEDSADEDPDAKDPLADEQLSTQKDSESQGQTKYSNLNYSVDPTTGKYKCRLCSKEYLETSGFHQHYKNVHLNIRYNCDHCEKAFARRADYNLHYKNVHMGVRFKCSGCDKLYSMEKTLLAHQRATGCGKRRGLSSDLEVDSSKVKTLKFKCSGCEKSFAVKKSLRKHHQRTICGKKLGLSNSDSDSNSKHKLLEHKKQSNINEELSGSDLGEDEYGSPNEIHGDSGTDSNDSNTASNTITPGINLQKRASPSPPKVVNKLASSLSSESTGVGVPVPRSSIDPETGRHKCSHCSLEFETTPLFETHYKSTHLKGRYECPLCGVDLPHTVESYLTHYRTVHMNTGVKSNICIETLPLSTKHRLKNQHQPHTKLERLEVDSDTRAAEIKMEEDSADDEAPLADFGEEDLDQKDPLADEEFQEPESKEVLNQKYSFDSTTGKYKCLLCSKEYSGTSGCLAHYKSVHLEIRYECDLCEKSFARRQDYNRHKQNVHMGVRFKCSGCEKLFTMKKSLREHQHQQRGGCSREDLAEGSAEIKIERDSNMAPTFKCRGCENSYTVKKSLKRHQQRTGCGTGRGPVNEEGRPADKKHGRGKSNISEVLNQKHIMPPPPIVFKISPSASSATDAGLPVSPSSINPETGNPKCSHCSLEFTSMHNFERHLKVKYECVLCGEKLCHRHHYLRHYRTVHMGISNKFKCDICNKKFLANHHLKRHKLMHSKQKKVPLRIKRNPSMRIPQISLNPETGRFHCTLCPEDFEDKVGFQSHYWNKHRRSKALISLNPETRLFHCPLCPKKFKDYEGFRRHHRSTHLQISLDWEPPKISLNPETGRFHCTLCPEDFGDKMSFRSHYLYKHKGYQLKCDICDQMFRRKTTLKRHQLLHKKDPTVDTPLLCLNPETKRFHCPLCPKNFKDYEGFRLHHRSTHLQIRYDCSECDKRFVSKQYLNRHHKKVHLGVIDIREPEHHQCHLCEKSYPRKYNLKLHQRSGNCGATSGLEPSNFNCPDCSKGFSTEAQVNAHRDIIHSGAEFECEFCNKSFKLKHYLKSHQLRTCRGRAMGLESSRTFNDKPLKTNVCPECGKVFYSTASCNAHMQSMHLGVKFECKVCKKSYKWKLSLYEHQQKTSCGVAMGIATANCSPKDICHLCGRGFTHIRNLKAHMRTVHENNQRHKCEHCEKTFGVRSTLEKHVQSVHLGIRFDCEVCKKSFSQKGLLQSHHIWTSCGAALGMKPAPKQNCQVCGKEFNCRDVLRLHMKHDHPEHKAEKKFPCDICGNFFLSASHLKVHYNGVHLKLRKNQR